MSIPKINNHLPNLYISSYTLDELISEKVPLDPSSEKVAVPGQIFLAGPAPSNRTDYNADPIDSLVEELKDAEIPLPEKVKIYRTIRKRSPGSSYLAEAMLELGQAFEVKDKIQEAIGIYLKLTKIRTFKGTKYARQAFKYLGNIYASMEKPNIKASVKYYTASLNRKRPEMNFPLYYEMAKLFDKEKEDAIKIPKKAVKYFLLFYKSYLLFKRFYSKKNVTIQFDEKGFDKSDPSSITEMLFRLLMMYLELNKIPSALQILKELSFIAVKAEGLPKEAKNAYLEVVKAYNRKGKYHEALRIYSMAKKIIGEVDGKLKIEAATSYKGKWFQIMTKAKKLRDKGSARNIAAANVLYKQAEKAFFECVKIFESFGRDTKYHSTALLQLGGLYELAGSLLKAQKVYIRISTSALDSDAKAEAKIRLAFLKGDAEALVKIAKERSHRYSSLIGQLSKFSDAIKRAEKSGLPGLITTHVLAALIIRKFRNYHFIYDEKNTLLTIIRGGHIRVRGNRIEFPQDRKIGRNFKIIFKNTKPGGMPGIMRNYNVLIRLMQKIPKVAFKGLRAVVFQNEQGAHYGGKIIGVGPHGAEEDIAHEMGHFWKDMKPRKMQLFSSISWEKGLRREEDQRDFEGNCQNPERFDYIKPTKLSVQKKYFICSNRRKIPYGMNNRGEDLATQIEKYFGSGIRLRAKAYKQLRGSFTLSANEFVSGLTPSRLLQEVLRKFPAFRLAGSTALEKLNSLIKTPSFYSTYVKSVNLQLNDQLRDLIKVAENVKNEKFSNLSKMNQGKVMKLNRLLLEKILSAFCPKINDKVDNIEPILKYLFVKYMTPFAGKEYPEHRQVYYIIFDLFVLERNLTKWLKTHPNDANVKRGIAFIQRIKESKEFYSLEGVNLRYEIRKKMKKGKFELAVKYLQNKYKVFRGKEFIDPDEREDKPLTIQEVKKTLDKQLKSNPGTVAPGIIRAINNYVRRYGN